MPNPFNFNSLKGRMAEQLIQDLFIQNDYNVFNYGLERLHPSLSKMIKFNDHTTSKELRYMPDFVVQSTLNGDLFYMEVKFRANGYFAFDEKYDNYPYRNAWFVIVSPDKIQCMHYKHLKKGNAISSETNYKLGSVRSFHFNADSIKEYAEYARLMFGAFK
ncbi:MAG: hypothetical protein NTZ33_06360 [Bacteroidetes bacterium]|nr:hypothetical protein [Bacteroidota bacterium]